MINELINNTDLDFEHQQWRMELSFWEDELKIFKHRLEELVTRWTDKDMLAELTSFQNQFIVHGEVIDKLQHEINVHESGMAKHSAKGEDVLDTKHVKEHIAMRDRMQTQREIYGELKKKFFKFLTKYM